MKFTKRNEHSNVIKIKVTFDKELIDRCKQKLLRLMSVAKHRRKRNYRVFPSVKVVVRGNKYE